MQASAVDGIQDRFRVIYGRAGLPCPRCGPDSIIQVRGQAGERQVPKHDVAIVSGNGGILDHHACLVVGTQPRP